MSEGAVNEVKEAAAAEEPTVVARFTVSKMSDGRITLTDIQGADGDAIIGILCRALKGLGA